ncbi:hypothetical protein [Nostoc sp.]|uniref:hypothetical protein n=1 Tax=Nostoc sp. TaxID=1180 RepID=UPI002FF5AAE8
MSNLNNLTSVVTYITCKFEYSAYRLGLIHRVYQVIPSGASARRSHFRIVEK